LLPICLWKGRGRNITTYLFNCSVLRKSTYVLLLSEAKKYEAREDTCISNGGYTLTDFHNYIRSFRSNFIVGGDYNAKRQSRGCRSNDQRCCILYNYGSAKNLNVITSPNPTYWPSSPRKNSDILVIFVTKIPSILHPSAVNLLDHNSDHLSIFLHLIPFPLLALSYLNFLMSLLTI